MGMCKKCQSVFNDSKLTLGYCVTCYPQINESVLKKEEERRKQELIQTEERMKQELTHEKKINNILILSGAVNKEHTLHGMVSVVAEDTLHARMSVVAEDTNRVDHGLHSFALVDAEFQMRELLVNLEFDGIVNTKIDSTVTLGKRKNKDGIPSYSVVMYGDAFSYV
jgi:hypothetical protein